MIDIDYEAECLEARMEADGFTPIEIERVMRAYLRAFEIILATMIAAQPEG